MAAHLGAFAGLWFIAPLGIYLWKRDSSPFASFHATQSLLLCGLQLVAGTLGAILIAIGYVLAAAALSAGAGGAAVAGAALVMVLGLAAIVLPTVLSLVGGYHAFEGKCWKMPLVGGMAERWFQRYESERRQAQLPSS